MRDPLTDDGNVQASQQWAINGGPPPGQQWWATTGPSSIPPLGRRWRYVMAPSYQPALAQRRGIYRLHGECLGLRAQSVHSQSVGE